MVSAHNKTFFFFFSRALNKKKRKKHLWCSLMKAVRVQQWKPDTRCVILSSAELQMVENVRVRNQSGRFHKTKTKKTQKGVRFPLSRWNYTCFSSQLCFCLHAASFYFKYVTHRRLNASEKSSNYSVRVWKSPFECRSPALCGFTRGHFSVFWLISHLKHRVHADTSRPRTPRLPFKRLFEVTVIPQTCFLVGWVQRCSLLCHGFNRIQRVKYERKRWSTLIFDCES